jgi:hypothetical protein
VRRGPFSVWLESKQERHDAAVPATLRTPDAVRLVRRGDRTVVLTIVAGFGLCLLLGLGSRSPVLYAVLGLAALAGLVAGGATVARLARLERSDDPTSADAG